MARKDLTPKQLEHLELSVSSGAPQHRFVQALAKALDEKHDADDKSVLLKHIKAEPHWLDRNKALCALLGVKLEEVAPPPPPPPTVASLTKDNVQLRSQVDALLSKVAELEQQVAELLEAPSKPKK